MISFNPHVRLVLADVDETVADVYTNAAPGMIEGLNKLLSEKKVLFLISGGGLQSIRERIVDKISPSLRHRVLVAHCMGAEVWGFQKNGSINNEPYYGVYDTCMNQNQKDVWRKIITETIQKFQLVTYPTQPKKDFISASNANPYAVMLADRGPQITFEFVNSSSLTEEQKNEIEKKLNIKINLLHDSYDLRLPILEYLKERYEKEQLPIAPKYGGTCALDSIIGGVDKTKAIKFVLSHDFILKQLDIDKDQIKEAEEIEIWGDKYSQKKGGPDFDMCRAVSPKVRAINFRDENPADMPPGYNIQFWDGKERLHNGLLEYLKSRST